MKKHHFEVVFVGEDWKGTERWIYFEEKLKEVGVDVVYTPYTKEISTTKLRQNLGEEITSKTDKS